MPEIKIRTNWQRQVVRLLSEGRPETEALLLAKVGRAKFNYALRRDENFAREVEAAKRSKVA